METLSCTIFQFKNVFFLIESNFSSTFIIYLFQKRNNKLQKNVQFKSSFCFENILTYVEINCKLKTIATKVQRRWIVVRLAMKQQHKCVSRLVNARGSVLILFGPNKQLRKMKQRAKRIASQPSLSIRNPFPSLHSDPVILACTLLYICVCEHVRIFSFVNDSYTAPVCFHFYDPVARIVYFCNVCICTCTRRTFFLVFIDISSMYFVRPVWLFPRCLLIVESIFSQLIFFPINDTDRFQSVCWFWNR